MDGGRDAGGDTKIFLLNSFTLLLKCEGLMKIYDSCNSHWKCIDAAIIFNAKDAHKMQQTNANIDKK